MKSLEAENLKDKTIKIALVAGEDSGDQLGSSLMKDLNQIFPLVSFIGVGGPKMEDSGLDSFFEMKRISVMGIIEPLLKIFELLSLRKGLKEFLLKEKPDLFIGIDSPDFNLPISKYLKRNGIKTIQYVSPSIWAWRKGRIKTIEGSVDKVLTLFPFENVAYKNSSVETHFVGHPLAHRISENIDKKELKKKNFNIHEEQMVALLPGSRKSEVLKMAEVFIKAAELIKSFDENTKFYMPLSDKNHKELIPNYEKYSWINFSVGNSLEVLAASDIGLITSGTASLEAALLRTPVVVSYKTNWLTYLIVKPLLNIDNFSLPNLLVGEAIFPELLQAKVTAENLFSCYKKVLENKGGYLNYFQEIHKELKADGPNTSAKVIVESL